MLLEEFFPVAKIHEMGSGSGQGEHPLRGLSADIHYDTTMRSRRYARSAVMEPATRIERATCGLRNRCSTN